MGRGTLAVVATLALASVFPGASSAQTPAQDSVALTGGPGLAEPFTIVAINATSGPSGENPTGQVRFDVSIPASGRSDSAER